AEQNLKQQSSTLKESEARFRSVTESANEAIVIAEGDGRILFWNQAAVSMFGISESEAVGRSIDIIIPERHRATFRRAASGGDSRAAGRPIEMDGLRAGGREIPLELSVSSWTVGGRRFVSGIM